MTLSFPIPPRLNNDRCSEDDAYGRYIVSKDDDFMAHLMARCPTIEWENPTEWSEWNDKHGDADTLLAYGDSPTVLGNTFDDNSAEVQLEQVYQLLRIYLDGWGSGHGRVHAWFTGFDIFRPFNTANGRSQPKVKYSLHIAFYHND